MIKMIVDVWKNGNVTTFKDVVTVTREVSGDVLKDIKVEGEDYTYTAHTQQIN